MFKLTKEEELTITTAAADTTESIYFRGEFQERNTTIVESGKISTAATAVVKKGECTLSSLVIYNNDSASRELSVAIRSGGGDVVIYHHTLPSKDSVVINKDRIIAVLSGVPS